MLAALPDECWTQETQQYAITTRMQPVDSKVCKTASVPCLQSQQLQAKSSITRSGTLQTRAEKACLDVLSRLDADLPMSAIHGAFLANTLPALPPPPSSMDRFYLL